MIPKEIFEYVKAQRAAGKADPEIRQGLSRKGGWSTSEINSVMGEPSKSEKTALAVERYSFSARLIFLSVVAGSLVFFLYLALNISSDQEGTSIIRTGRLLSDCLGTAGFSCFVSTIIKTSLEFIIIALLSNLIFGKMSKGRTTAMAIAIVWLLLKGAPLVFGGVPALFYMRGFLEIAAAFAITGGLAWLFASRYAKWAILASSVLALLLGGLFFADSSKLRSFNFVNQDSVPRIDVPQIAKFYNEIGGRALKSAVPMNDGTMKQISLDYSVQAKPFDPCGKFYLGLLRAECESIYKRSVDDYAYETWKLVEDIAREQIYITSAVDIQQGTGDDLGLCDARIILFIGQTKPYYYQPCRVFQNIAYAKGLNSANDSNKGMWPASPGFGCPLCSAVFGMKVGGVRKVSYVNYDKESERGTMQLIDAIKAK